MHYNPPIEIDQYNSTQIACVGNFSELGAANGCVFCKGRMIEKVKEGDRIVLLSGMWANEELSVVAESSSLVNEFIARRGNDETSWTRTISYSRERFAFAPIGEPANWTLPISTSDACYVEDRLLQRMIYCAEQSQSDRITEIAKTLAATIWWARLPLTNDDLAPWLLKHGMPPKIVALTLPLVDFGRSLLISTHGRPPIKRKRMKALAFGQYETKKAKLLWDMLRQP